ncbi:hypothetical protein D3C72_2553800 [compost metagenome]
MRAVGFVPDLVGRPEFFAHILFGRDELLQFLDALLVTAHQKHGSGHRGSGHCKLGDEGHGQVR